MLAINVSIPNLNKHECSHLAYWTGTPAVNQVFIYVKFSYAYQFTYQISAWIFKISIFNSQNGQEGGTASLCHILSKSLQPWPTYRDFSIFEDGVMASAIILDF